LLLRHSQQKHCLHVVALLLHSVVQSSFCNGSLATLQAGPLQAGPTGRTISALIAATRNMRSFIRKDHSFIAAQDKRITDAMDGIHSMRSSMKTTPPSPPETSATLACSKV